MQELIKSKRFWAAVATLAAVLLKDTLGLSEDEVQQVVMIVAAWIVGDSWRATDPKKDMLIIEAKD